MSDQVGEVSLAYHADVEGSVLPEGYKQTEVGVIPEGWELKKLADGVSLVSGHHVMAQYCNSEGVGVPYLTGPADFPHGQIIVSKYTDRPTSMCEFGDILITVKGSGAGSLVEADGAYCISRQLMAIRARAWDSKFINFSIHQNSEAIKSAAAGLIPGLSRSDILEQKLPIPPLSEQTAIANALSDVDALISEQEKLIAKKQAIKTATMQQLLTGRTRLPPFALREDGSQKGYKQSELGEVPGDWELQDLADGVSLVSGHHVVAQYCNSEGVGVPYLTGPADFPHGKIIVSKYTDRPTSMCEYGDILITVKGSGAGSLVEADGAYCVSRQLMAIRARVWDSKFINFSILQNAEAIKSAAAGLIPGLSRSDILEQKLPIPPLLEQAYIANFLTSMNAEIKILQHRLAKTCQIKQGMMQELLTGKTRLLKPLNEESAND